jgi:hypothetical protein
MKKMLVAAASMVAAGGILFTAGASAQPSSSLQLVVIGGATAGSAPAAPAYGSQVTFNVQTGAQQPWVSVACSQNGTGVYGQYWGFWNGYSPSAITSTMAANGVFTLGPTALWSSGSAACVATLYSVSKNSKQTTLATLRFTANA